MKRYLLILLIVLSGHISRAELNIKQSQYENMIDSVAFVYSKAYLTVYFDGIKEKKSDGELFIKLKDETEPFKFLDNLNKSGHFTETWKEIEIILGKKSEYEKYKGLSLIDYALDTNDNGKQFTAKLKEGFPGIQEDLKNAFTKKFTIVNDIPAKKENDKPVENKKEEDMAKLKNEIFFKILPYFMLIIGLFIGTGVMLFLSIRNMKKRISELSDSLAEAIKNKKEQVSGSYTGNEVVKTLISDSDFNSHMKNMIIRESEKESIKKAVTENREQIIKNINTINGMGNVLYMQGYSATGNDNYGKTGKGSEKSKSGNQRKKDMINYPDKDLKKEIMRYSESPTDSKFCAFTESFDMGYSLYQIYFTEGCGQARFRLCDDSDTQARAMDNAERFLKTTADICKISDDQNRMEIEDGILKEAAKGIWIVEKKMKINIY